nr:MFS transporter [Vallitaleaceae bacterium]
MSNKIKGLFHTEDNMPRDVYVLVIARIINRLGGFVHAFLTLFLTIRLGMSPLEAGRIILFLGFAGIVGTMVGGSLGDILGRTRTYIIAQGMAALLLIPCGFLGDALWIPYLLIISTFFNTIVGPISSAMLIDMVKKEDRKRAFSLLYYGIN